MPETTPRINLIFKGLMVSCIKDGRDFAEIGLIHSATEHQLEITISIDGNDFALPEDFDPKQDISLEVKNTSKSGIRVFTADGFNREAGVGNEKDFRWSVDIEGREVYDRPLGVEDGDLV